MANISEGIFGTKVTKQGSQGKSETDAYTLCDSQHTVWVYTTDYLNDGSITPGEDNIIVSFSGIDSAGTGCAGDILMGGLKIFIDPVDWWTTVGTGLAHEDSIIGRGSFVGDAAVDSGAAGGICSRSRCCHRHPRQYLLHTQSLQNLCLKKIQLYYLRPGLWNHH